MKVLLLAGTEEARRIACGLAEIGINAVASLAGATRVARALPVPTRIGGFGGEAGFRTYVHEHKITAVLDATHPFAAKITARTARICREIGLPYGLVRRPEWCAQDGDNWVMIPTPHAAAAQIPDDAVVFLATGRQTLAQYSNLAGRRVLARVIDPPRAPFPFAGGEFVIGRPPFTVHDEVATFRTFGVTHLVVKNAGGAGGRAKLDAARLLGIPVVMLARPSVPQATLLCSVDEAMSWVAALDAERPMAK